jgi:hypothetical protein
VIWRYSKHGSGTRVEVRGGERCAIVFREGGEAWEEEGVFSCRPIPFRGETAAAVDLPARLFDLLDELSVAIERATLVVGVSLHRHEEADEETSWREETARLHLALANRSSRVRGAVDRGGVTGSDRWLEEIRRIAGTLERAGPRPVITRGQILLDPAITAAILSAIVLSGGPLPTDPALIQIPRERERDGRGRLVEVRAIGGAGSQFAGAGAASQQEGLTETAAIRPWPSYRPSYRSRPVRLPFGVDLARETADAVAAVEAKGVALCGEIEITRRSVRLPLLVEDGGGRVGESIVELRREQLDHAIVAVGRERTWYPFLGGVWGRSLLIDPSCAPPLT